MMMTIVLVMRIVLKARVEPGVKVRFRPCIGSRFASSTLDPYASDFLGQVRASTKEQGIVVRWTSKKKKRNKMNVSMNTSVTV